MEDLTFQGRGLDQGGPLHMLDKNQIISLDTAKVIMESLAHFHGVWLTWLTRQEPKTIGGMSKKQFLKVFAYNMDFKHMTNLFGVHK